MQEVEDVEIPLFILGDGAFLSKTRIRKPLGDATTE